MFYNSNTYARARCYCNPCYCGEDGCACCWRTIPLGGENQRTDDVHHEVCVSGSVIKISDSSVSSNGNLYYNWGKTTYADDCLSASSSELNLRGGFAEGNAFCIKTNKTITGTVEDQSKYLYGDTTGTSKHYSIAKNYDGIFSYSSSEYVRQEYITHRSVIRNQ